MILPPHRLRKCVAYAFVFFFYLIIELNMWLTQFTTHTHTHVFIKRMQNQKDYKPINTQHLNAQCIFACTCAYKTRELNNTSVSQPHTRAFASIIIIIIILSIIHFERACSNTRAMHFRFVFHKKVFYAHMYKVPAASTHNL